MTLRTPLRSAAPKTEATESWSKPPRAANLATAANEIGANGRTAIPARTDVFFEAEWVDSPSPRGHGASLPALPPAPAPAPVLPAGLARLLNAALIDSNFAALFLASPVDAARRAIEGAGEVFGTSLPDPALRLTLPALSEAEWALLRRLPHTDSLAAAAQELRRLASPATIHDLVAYSIQPVQGQSAA